jgi:hypothetical protein
MAAQHKADEYKVYIWEIIVESWTWLVGKDI